MQSGKNYILHDVWGFAPNDVYASGGLGIGVISYPVLLHYNGEVWESLVDSASHYGGQVQTVWGISSKNVYYWATFGFFDGSIKSGWNMQTIPNDNTFMRHMRGSSANNIFIIGDFSIILHYNGSTWHRYDEIYRKPGGDIFSSIFVIDKTVLIVGRELSSARALIYKGTLN